MIKNSDILLKNSMLYKRTVNVLINCADAFLSDDTFSHDKAYMVLDKIDERCAEKDISSKKKKEKRRKKEKTWWLVGCGIH